MVDVAGIAGVSCLTVHPVCHSETVYNNTIYYRVSHTAAAATRLHDMT